MERGEGPITASKDQFGNLTVDSPFRACCESKDLTMPSTMLVSAEGQKLVALYPTLLSDIDKAVVTTRNNDLVDTTSHKVGENGTITYVNSGAHSDIYEIEIGGSKQIVKVSRKGKSDTIASQPYTNEMLQTQYIARELQKLLASGDIEMQRFILATDKLAIVEYAGEAIPSQGEVDRRMFSVIPVVDAYIRLQQKKHNPLWNDVFLDVGLRNGKALIKNENCRLRDNRTLIWVDPFVKGLDVNPPKSPTSGNFFARWFKPR